VAGIPPIIRSVDGDLSIIKELVSSQHHALAELTRSWVFESAKLADELELVLCTHRIRHNKVIRTAVSPFLVVTVSRTTLTTVQRITR
jgi:hypothetical protein